MLGRDKARKSVEEELENGLGLASEREREPAADENQEGLGERGRQASHTRGHARLDPAPHGALGGSAQAPAPLVTGAPTSTRSVSRLGIGGRSDAGRRVEAMGVKEGVPFAVGVRRGNGCNEGHGGLSGLWCSNGSVSRSAWRTRGRLQRA